MSKILLQNEHLTEDDLLSTLQRALAGRFDVYFSKYPAVSIAVRKSGWCGIAVRKVKQLEQGTEVTYNPFVPSFLRNFLFGGLILQLFMRSAQKELLQEFEVALRDPENAGNTNVAPEGAHSVPRPKPANPAIEAAWLGATALIALALPSLMHGFWYFPPIVAGVIITTLVAFGLSFAAPGAGGSSVRGAVVGLMSGMAGMLGSTLLIGNERWERSLSWELSYWATPPGAFQLGLFVASGVMMARSQRRPAAVPSTAPIAAV